eukprot:1358382-Prymnesium_polylepis.1
MQQIELPPYFTDNTAGRKVSQGFQFPIPQHLHLGFGASLLIRLTKKARCRTSLKCEAQSLGVSPGLE